MPSISIKKTVRLLALLEGEHNPQLSFLEQLVEEQKTKRTLSNKTLIRRISKGANHIFVEEDIDDNNPLNESFPDHFQYMKNEDSINEMRPHKEYH